MDEARWDRIASLFLDAIERPTEGRAVLLADVRRADAGVHAELAAMLAAHGDRGALALERRLLSGDGEPRPALAPLDPGTRVGAYRIEAFVGEGGMGEVYRAARVDGGYRQTVAIKLLRPGYATAEAVRRFRVERQVLARLVHPGIAAIHDGGTADDGRPYLVMEFVDGVQIAEYCDRHQLGVPQRLRLWCQVAAAVQFAHGQLVVHRDLKPSNILVSDDGGPRLLDFGIAKLLDEWSGDSLAVPTRPEVRLLTPGYAAPEQLRGEPVSVAVDVYGLGVLLYELLAGRRPFDPAGMTPTEFERAVLHDPAPAPSTVAPRTIAGDLDRIVLMALRKEPARRYATAAQFVDDVERYLAGRPVRAQRDTLAYRARKFVTRNRALVGAGIAAALLVGGFGATSAIQARRIAHERDRAEQERAAAEDVVGLLTKLFERANPSLVPGGDTVRVAALLDEGERLVDSLAPHRDRQARLWRVLGNMRSARGEYDRARPLLRRSWVAQRAIGGPDDVEAVRTYHELAVLTSAFEGEAAARPMLDTSVAALRRLLGDGHSDIAKALQDRAAAAASADERRRLLDQAVAVWGRQPEVDSTGIAALLNAQGTASYERGDFARARPLFEAAIRILERRVPAEHPALLNTTHNLASVLGGLGEWAPAETLTRRIIAAAASSTGGRGRGVDTEGLALLAANQGRLAEAEVGVRAALAQYRATLAPDHWRVDNTLRNLAVVVMARGRTTEGLAILDSARTRARARPGGPTSKGYGYMTGQRVRPLLHLGRLDAADAAAREGERVVRAAVPEGHAYLVEVARWRGEVALARGDATGAEVWFRDALRRTRGALPEDHPKVAGSACLLGAALARQGRSEEARRHLEAACPRYARWGLADSLTMASARSATRSLQDAPGRAGTRTGGDALAHGGPVERRAGTRRP